VQFNHEVSGGHRVRAVNLNFVIALRSRYLRHPKKAKKDEKSRTKK
jgi:hypothetical protein